MVRNRQAGAEEALRRLSSLIDAHEGCRLPPLASLARTLSLPVAVTGDAVRILRNRGILTARRGQGIRIASRVVSRAPARRAPARVSPRHTAAEVLRERLRTRILGDELRPGDLLPKIGHAATSQRVTGRTVSTAYAMLCSDGLVHRRGRQWVVGPPPGEVPAITVQFRPAILLLVAREDSWTGLHAERTRRFCTTFTEEADRRGVCIHMATASLGGLSEDYCAGGHEGVQALVGRLDDRFAGSLIAGTTAEIGDIRGWIDCLAATGRPVVWFDRLDEHLEGPPLPRNVTRCHFAGEAAHAEALDALASAGHRVVSMPNQWRRSWRMQRARELERLGSVRTPPVLFADPVAPAGTDPDSIATGEPEALFDACRRAGSPHHRKVLALVRRRLLAFHRRARGVSGGGDGGVKRTALNHFNRLVRYTPVLTELVTRGDVTAVLAPNDQDARAIYAWFRTMGVAIPVEMSLLSFDNSPAISPLPVSTVDFGFGYLGYCAFHLIYQDTPVTRERGGNVPARPAVIHRGSIGAPRQAPLRLARLAGIAD